MNLADDNPLCTIINEGPPISHNGNIPHVNIFLSYFSGSSEEQIDFCLDRNGIGVSLRLTFHLIIFDVALIQRIMIVIENHVMRLTLNGKCILEHLFQSK